MESGATKSTTVGKRKKSSLITHIDQLVSQRDWLRNPDNSGQNRETNKYPRFNLVQTPIHMQLQIVSCRFVSFIDSTVSSSFFLIININKKQDLELGSSCVLFCSVLYLCVYVSVRKN